MPPSHQPPSRNSRGQTKSRALLETECGLLPLFLRRGGACQQSVEADSKRLRYRTGVKEQVRVRVRVSVRVRVRVKEQGGRGRMLRRRAARLRRRLRVKG